MMELVFVTVVGRDAGDRTGDNEWSFERMGRERSGSRVEWRKKPCKIQDFTNLQVWSKNGPGVM